MTLRMFAHVRRPGGAKNCLDIRCWRKRARKVSPPPLGHLNQGPVVLTVDRNKGCITVDTSIGVIIATTT